MPHDSLLRASPTTTPLSSMAFSPLSLSLYSLVCTAILQLDRRDEDTSTYKLLFSYIYFSFFCLVFLSHSILGSLVIFVGLLFWQGRRHAVFLRGEGKNKRKYQTTITTAKVYFVLSLKISYYHLIRSSCRFVEINLTFGKPPK